jgi:predicted DCC family thiol-disulfide oxidoreductase YuxK
MNKLSDLVLPITVFYDASCPICEAEMTALKARDLRDEICLIDCSSPTFDDSAFLMQGISRELMIKRIHGVDAIGRWYVGVDLFAVVYGVAQMKWLARFLGSSMLRPVLVRLYPWVADNRTIMSKLKLQGLFKSRLFKSRLFRQSSLVQQANCQSDSCKRTD